jgi:hypothetical protein
MGSSLVTSAEKGVPPMPIKDSASVIPAHALSAIKQASATKAAPRSFKAGYPYGDSSGRKGGNAGRGPQNHLFPNMTDRDLLQMKAMEQTAYEAATMGYAHQVHPRQQFTSNMVSRHEYPVPESNYTRYQSHHNTFGPSIFSPGYSIGSGGHACMGNSWHNEPSVTANVWGNSIGLVTHSQQPFSWLMGEVSGPMNYSQIQHIGARHGQ